MLRILLILALIGIVYFVGRDLLRLVFGREKPRRQAQLPPPASAPVDLAAERRRRLPAPVEGRETRTCALLRRRVPGDAGGEALSWFGGLPRMPADVPWPEAGGRPLNFLAQIHLGDLPEGLWGGHGPRAGWLLAFMDPLFDGAGEDAVRFVRVEAPDLASLGPERPAPAGLGPIDHDYRIEDQCSPLRPKPTVWRRWPVDIIAHDQRFDPEGLTLAPAVFWQAGEDGIGERHEDAPLLAGAARLAVDLADERLEAMERDPGPPLDPPRLAAMIAEDAADVAAEVARLDAELARQRARGRRYESNAQRVAEARDKAKERHDWLLARATPGAAETLAEELSAFRAQAVGWAGRMRAGLGPLRAELADLGQFDPAPEGFADRFAALQRGEDPDRPQQYPYSGLGRRWRPEEIRRWKIFGDPAGINRARLLDAAASGEGLDRMPPAAAAAALRLARRCDDGIHRLGGWRDPLQEGPDPDDAPLLLQLCSDEAMGWCWGDVGTFWFTLTPEALQAGDLSQVSVGFECH